MNLTIEPRESHVLARIEDARLDALSAQVQAALEHRWAAGPEPTDEVAVAVA